MAQSVSGDLRLDPYKDFKLRFWDGERTYSGSMLTGLFPPLQTVQPPSGGDPSTSHESMGRNQYDSITLSRGVTQDSSFSAWANQGPGQSKYSSIQLNRGVTQDSAFGAWANQPSGQGKYPTIPLERGVIQVSGFSAWAANVWNYGGGTNSVTSPGHLRREINLQFYNGAGALVVKFRITGRSVFESQATPLFGIFQHFLQPGGPVSIPDQLAVIFETAQGRSKP
jgi:hypothetical protein